MAAHMAATAEFSPVPLLALSMFVQHERRTKAILQCRSAGLFLTGHGLVWPVFFLLLFLPSLCLMIHGAPFSPGVYLLYVSSCLYLVSLTCAAFLLPGLMNLLEISSTRWTRWTRLLRITGVTSAAKGCHGLLASGLPQGKDPGNASILAFGKYNADQL